MHHEIDQIESKNKASVFKGCAICAWKLARCTHELFIFLRVGFAWSKTKLVTVITHAKTDGMDRNLPENNYIACLTLEYSDWNIATSKWHLGEEVAWLSVINNSQEKRGGGNGLQYNYVVGSVHPEGTFLKNSQQNFPLLLPFRFLFSSENYKKIAIRGH